uniref:Uncharacterized protein n=1 Tax=Helianthus annuus TaxID=4232 RepID=A0A251UJS5_HELAN
MALHDGDGRRPPECLATGLGFRRVWRRGWCLPAMVVKVSYWKEREIRETVGGFRWFTAELRVSAILSLSLI